MNKINITASQKRKLGTYVNNSQNSLPENEKLLTFEVKTDPFTFQLNSILRAKLETENLGEFLADLDDTFNQYKTPNAITVYRAFNYQEMLRNLYNNIYIEFGYMSTSENIATIGRFFENRLLGYFPAFLTINIPKDTNILVLDNINDFENTAYEKEILIKRKAKFVVLTNVEIESQSLDNSISKYHLLNIPKIRKLELNFVEYIQ